MGKRYSHLSLEERCRLRGMIEMDLSVSEIARRMDRHRSTIQRELERNRCADGYRPDSAGRRAWARKLRGSKIERSTRLRAHVEDRLAMGWSPEQIAGRMELEGAKSRVSAELIYRHAYSPAGRGAGLPRLLAQRRPKRGRRRRNGRREPAIPNRIPIHQRPTKAHLRLIQIPVDNAEAFAFLRAEGWLSTLPRDLQEALASRLVIRHLGSGEWLFHAGSAPGGLVGLARGCLTVEVLVGPRPPQPCFLIHEGAWMGEGTTAALSTRLVGLRAVRRSTVAIIGRDAFNQVAAAAPDLWRYLLGVAMENNARAVRMADALMERDSRKRLALVLLQLSGAHDAYGVRPAVIEMDQSTLAASANLSRSAASPLLRAMQAGGILVVERKSIRIVDLKKLEETAAS